MGKRTNPVGLRLGFSEKWQVGLPPVSRLRYANHYLPGAVKIFLMRFVVRRDDVLFWSKLVGSGSIYRVHLFLSALPDPLALWALRRSLRDMLGICVRVSCHLLRSWVSSTRRRRKRLIRVLGRYRGFRAFRKTRFFFYSGALLRLGFRTGSAEIVVRVASDILKKHNKRHWLVFRFLRRTLRILQFSSRYVSGVRFQLAGKVMGRRRKRRRLFRYGRVAHQSVGRDLDYSSCAVATKFGAFGLRVWVQRKSIRPSGIAPCSGSAVRMGTS